jgi:D-alanyl-D-alanine carboxypeptidase
MLVHASTEARQRRSSLGCALVLAALASTHAACSSDAPSAPPAPAADAGPDPSPPAPVEPPGDPAKAACDAQTTALRAALAKAHDADTDAVLAVKNACGVRVLTDGPSKLDGTELQRIGSVTKTYVAAVILTLVREGALGLDDAVSKWVENIPGGDGITVRELLRHTSGLFNYTDDKTFVSHAITKDGTWTPRQLVDVAIAHPPYFEPGKDWRYSNTNYVLLGMIAEAAGKAKIGALVRSRVLEPVGATATFFDGEEPVSGKLAVGLDTLGRDMRVVGPSWAWAAGAMVAAPGDLVTWIEKLGSGAFYDATQEAEVKQTVATDTLTLGYGLGLMVLSARATAGAGTGYGHGGDTPGYHTQAFYFPASKTTIVAIVDRDGATANDISAAALGVLFAAR